MIKSLIILQLIMNPLVTCQNETIIIKDPNIMRQMSIEEIEAGRQLPKSPPLGTSTFHMSRLAREEVKVADKLTDLALLFENIGRVLKRYAASWQELLDADVSHEGWAQHPLHAYALAKHVSIGWPAIEYALMNLKQKASVIDGLLDRRNSSGVPTSEDLTDVASGLARIHDFYSLNLTALADAHVMSRLNVQPVTAKITPTVWDLHRIGTEAVRVNIWNSGVDFLRAALERYNFSSSQFANTRSSSSSSSSFCDSCEENGYHEHPYDNARDMSNIQETLIKTTKMHDQVLERKGSRTRSHSTHRKPLDKLLARKKKYHKKKEVVLGIAGTHAQALDQYVELCNGEDLRPVETTSTLYCRYVSNGSPIYLIGPLKMEVHSLSPYVVTIDGTVTPTEADDIILTGSKLLEKSSTFRFNGKSEVSVQRTSSTAWLWEHNSEHMVKLTARIEGLLGLNAMQHVGAETYQVVNYGVGGHYTVHHDATFSSAVHNRIATFLIYLTDVPQGGSTVFPWLGFGVRPKKGTSLLWYNLSRDGNRDFRVEHAACPVLYGDKWIINKWLNYGAQLTRVKCNLKNQDPYITQPLS